MTVGAVVAEREVEARKGAKYAQSPTMAMDPKKEGGDRNSEERRPLEARIPMH